MGLEFLGNPYENENEDESDVFEIERDEDWVVPIDINLLANRQNLLPTNYWSLSDEGSEFSSFEDDPDYIPEYTNYSDDVVEDNDIDNDSFHDSDGTDDSDAVDFCENPDEENYPQYDEFEEVFTQNGPGDYMDDVFYDDDDDDDEFDYVTHPIPTETPKPPEQQEKQSTNDINNSITNNSETNANTLSEQDGD